MKPNILLLLVLSLFLISCWEQNNEDISIKEENQIEIEAGSWDLIDTKIEEETIDEFEQDLDELFELLDEDEA